MIATIVYSNTATEEDHHSHGYYPHIYESDDIEKLRYKLIDLQYFLYRPDYIIVELNGYIYDATTPNTKDAKKLMEIIDGLAKLLE